MNFRFMAGICLLILAAAALPASALSGEVSIPVMSNQKSGTVWVTLTNISGPGQEGPVEVAYAIGNVSEINRAFVTEDPLSGVVTVTVNASSPYMYTLTNREPEGNESYAINSIAVAQESAPLLTNHQSFAVVPATANYYADTVPEGKQHEWIDLDWRDKNKDLGLTVFAPDATLGPYTDTSDGRKDGRIFLDIASRLNVTAGTWFFRVQNSREDYTPYTLNTYSA
ncbi:hypothetical protein [Methanoregula formicica]|uniref:Uncharacterized protein n=1 Tax=Methanoregula formicica (strain DSM 22288 / NBRC 105244 / SMSP) TaxID=593750 RepID=L0HCU4_METFS|nr:hypothetical protein [Methanoregula formicica]AGB01611.1 hypothetical protein Metfor_0542 [Methanoregula formicica SMSP]